MAATATRTNVRNPARSEQIEQWLAMRGVAYTFKADVPLDDVNVETSLRNQARGISFDQERADRLKIAYEDGNIFPALVGIKQGELIMLLDGNHRFWVLRDAGVTSYPMYLVDSKVNSENLQKLIFEANYRNGDRPSREDALKHAFWFYGTNGNVRLSARLAQIDEAYFRSEVNKKKYDREAAALNIPANHWKKYSAQAKQAIMEPRKGLKRDAEKVAFVRFTHALNLSVADVRNLVAEVRQLRTEKERMDFITQEIPRRSLQAATRPARRRLKHLLNMQMNGVLKNITTERQELLDDTTTIEQEELKTKVYELIKQLDSFRKALDESIKK